MAAASRARIGFVSGGSGSMPHYRTFFPMIPAEIELDLQALDLYGDSLYQIGGKKDLIVRRVAELAAARHWDALILTAAPTEVLNPGLKEALQTTLSVPFTTALQSCVAALRVYSSRRVLLLTPFDARLNDLICRHLQDAGLTAVAPHPFGDLAIPRHMAPDDVFELAKAHVDPINPVHAIYFQGAVLDPVNVIEKIETELGLTVIASNPAMLWYILSKLKLCFPIAGYGRLMREWPPLPAA